MELGDISIYIRRCFLKNFYVFPEDSVYVVYLGSLASKLYVYCLVHTFWNIKVGQISFNLPNFFSSLWQTFLKFVLASGPQPPYYWP